MKKWGWGIIATGKMSHAFVQDLRTAEHSQIESVFSRTLASANTFAKQYNIPIGVDDIQQLLHNNKVDIVYIANPHPFHKSAILQCLEAGKHVLCEKPLTLNTADSRECIDLAKRKGLFLMEAVWMRFFPAIHKVQSLLADNAIGTPQLFDASFCFNKPFDPNNRLFAPELGGGALLDVGIYPISLATLLFGQPTDISGQCHKGSTGVDDYVDIHFAHEGDIQSFLRASTRLAAPVTATIVGSEGHIHIHERFHHPSQITLNRYHSGAEEFHFPYTGNGYQYEIAEIEKCLAQGQLQSHFMSWQDTLNAMSLMDTLRSQWQIIYPQETK